MLTKKINFLEHKIVALSKELGAIFKHELPPKLKDPWSFILPCIVGDSHNINTLMDSRANINLMSLNIYRKLGLGK